MEIKDTILSDIHVSHLGDFVIVSPLATSDLLHCYEKHRNYFETVLLTHGGILFRGFSLNTVAKFNDFSNKVLNKKAEYIFRSTPRTNVGSGIYTATEYPADRSIPLHNENSYAHSWPQKILFYSVVVAQRGGATPIADSHKIYNSLDKSIIEKFDRLGVMYKRCFYPGFDLSWQEVFQTDEKLKVDEFCIKNSIDFEWTNENSVLRIKYVRQATLLHPIKNIKIWFNQAHLFHRSANDANDLSHLINQFGDDLPRDACYGDGSEIETDVLQQIRAAYEHNKLSFAWQPCDLMLLDNLLMAHGREPYQGARKVLVSMGS